MTPQNEPPKIPSFKPTQKKEKKGGAAPLSSLGKTTKGGFRFPGFGGKGGLPNLRVRGLPGGTSVIDRLKNLRKKDLMFIAAGLSVLCMAPLAEHFMMSPEDDPGRLQEGFDSKGPLFPDGTTVYESGTGGFSPGGLVGQGTDVITPLNVRDPSALVMGPGATRKPEASAAPPPTSTGKKKPKPSWKDALAESAKAGTKKAVKKARLPKPNVKMSGALRGLSALSGGGKSGASWSSGPLKSSAGLSKAKGSRSLTRSEAAPGYRGARSRSPASAPGPESLKGAGNRMADIFNKGGSASGNLDTAARETIPSGGGRGSPGGSPSKDKAGKNPSHKKPGDSKSLGESLEFLRRKMEMQNAIKLKWKKKEWNEFGRQKMVEEMFLKEFVGGIFKGLAEVVTGGIKGAAGQIGAPRGGPAGYTCVNARTGGNQLGTINFSMGQIAGRTPDGKGLRIKQGDSEVVYYCDDIVPYGGASAIPGGGEGGDNAGNQVDGVQPPGSGSYGNLPGTQKTLDVVCAEIKTAQELNASPALQNIKELMLQTAQPLVIARNNIYPPLQGGSAQCVTPTSLLGDLYKPEQQTISDVYSAVGTRLLEAKTAMKGVLSKQPQQGDEGGAEGLEQVAAAARTAFSEKGEALAAEVAGHRERTEPGFPLEKANDLKPVPGDADKKLPPLDEAIKPLEDKIKAAEELHNKADTVLSSNIKPKMDEGLRNLAAVKIAVETYTEDTKAKLLLESYLASLDAGAKKVEENYEEVHKTAQGLHPYHGKTEDARKATGKAVDSMRVGLGENADAQHGQGTEFSGDPLKTVIEGENGLVDWATTRAPELQLPPEGWTDEQRAVKYEGDAVTTEANQKLVDKWAEHVRTTVTDTNKRLMTGSREGGGVGVSWMDADAATLEIFKDAKTYMPTNDPFAPYTQIDGCAAGTTPVVSNWPKVGDMTCR